MGKKGKKSKGKGRGGKKSKKSRGHKSHKPGVAESLGILKTAFEVETNPTTAGLQKALFQHPSVATFRAALDSTVSATKDNAGPAVIGLVVSNIEVVPVFGKMAAPLKRRADRILKKWIGMKL